VLNLALLAADIYEFVRRKPKGVPLEMVSRKLTKSLETLRKDGYSDLFILIDDLGNFGIRTHRLLVLNLLKRLVDGVSGLRVASSEEDLRLSNLYW